MYKTHKADSVLAQAGAAEDGLTEEIRQRVYDEIIQRATSQGASQRTMKKVLPLGRPAINERQKRLAG